MALERVDKQDLSRAEPLSGQEQDAVRAVAGGAEDQELAALVLAVMKRARARGLRLGCGCRREGGRRPLVAPCRNHRGTDYWRVLAGPHLPHDEGCVFHRTHARRRDEALWNRPRKAPDGLFAVLRDRSEEQRVSRLGGRSEEEGELVSGVGRPVVGRNPIPPPYLFLGAVGMLEARFGYECVEGYAQPIVASDCPVPVDSHYERRAFGTLRTTLRVLSREFPDAAFKIEKPVFDIETPDGPCLPDFLIRARCGCDEVTFVVEVMGFERPEYLRGKEVTHPRMETLGTLCTMQAREFDRSEDGVRAEGRNVTETIRRVLQRRWAGTIGKGQ